MDQDEHLERFNVLNIEGMGTKFFGPPPVLTEILDQRNLLRIYFTRDGKNFELSFENVIFFSESQEKIMLDVINTLNSDDFLRKFCIISNNSDLIKWIDRTSLGTIGDLRLIPRPVESDSLGLSQIALS